MQTRKYMMSAGLVFSFCVSVAFGANLQAQAGDSEARPPVTKADLAIAKRAAEILNSPSKWNRADNRVCPPGATTFSLYCALEKATEEVTHNFQHRGAAMQEARFVIDEIAPAAPQYHHRLMDYNNDPNTTFADIQGVFWLLEKHIAVRLQNPQAASVAPGASSGAVTEADVQVVRRVRELLNSPAKWDRADTNCSASATTHSLICAFQKAEMEVTGSAEDGAAIREARAMISELDPNHKYQSRIVDYNADPAVNFAELQTFLKKLEDRLASRAAAK